MIWIRAFVYRQTFFIWVAIFLFVQFQADQLKPITRLDLSALKTIAIFINCNNYFCLNQCLLNSRAQPGFQPLSFRYTWRWQSFVVFFFLSVLDLSAPSRIWNVNVMTMPVFKSCIIIYYISWPEANGLRLGSTCCRLHFVSVILLSVNNIQLGIFSKHTVCASGVVEVKEWLILRHGKGVPHYGFVVRGGQKCTK